MGFKTLNNSRLRSAHLNEQAVGLLEVTDDLLRESCADVAVDDAVIEGERQVHHVADHDLVALHYWFSLHGVDAHDAALWVIDNRRGHQAAQLAQRRDGERGAA